MIELLLKLLDELNSLVTESHRTGEARFKNHVEPIYAMIQKVVANYRELLNRVEQAVNDGLPMEKISEGLGKRRKKYVLVRRDIEQYAITLTTGNIPQDVLLFVQGCFDILGRDPTEPGSHQLQPENATPLTSLLIFLQENPDRDKILNEIDAYRTLISKTAYKLSETYHELRVRSLK